MQKIDKQILRIIDANLNRTREGLRVCEDISRFALDSSRLCSGLKKVRHQIAQALDLLKLDTGKLLNQRDIRNDVGKRSIPLELLRKNVRDVFLANSQRVKESVRVLEEFSKIYNGRAAGRFKLIRYKIYHLEKEALTRLRNRR